MNTNQAHQRYDEERERRLRTDGIEQYIDLSVSDSKEVSEFLEDPWVGSEKVKDLKTLFPNDRCKLLILGAGWGGLQYAFQMIQKGMNAEDIRIVDIAAGFGGTWYWNRYPGLKCDIESYCYIPLLEETGHVPSQRYASGEEIRLQSGYVAQKWGVADNAVFQTKAERMVWNEHVKEWSVELAQKRKGEDVQTLRIQASFVATVNGVLNYPKIPDIAGLFTYKGDIFHSSRWNYAITGGSPAHPSLTKLEGKRVAIVGTGATAVQIVPHLAQWAEHLYVVQRTPAAVDHFEQRQTDPQWFRKEVASQPGWQRERHRNFHQHLTTEKQPATNLVNDGWTRAVGMVAIAGNQYGPKDPAGLPEYMKKLHDLDLPRQDRIRRRVEEEVHDAAVAEKLKAWYPTWCKRPAFSDDYLTTFNRANVTLLDTDGKGLDRFGEDCIFIGDKSYTVDVVIFATGFRAPFTGSPAQKANMDIIGRQGVSMDEEWARNGPSTQHGVMDHNFPNLFLSGPWQASNSPNYLFNVGILAKLAAHIWGEADCKAKGGGFAVSPSAEAAEKWGACVLMNSVPMAAIIGCTPGYFNVEGTLDRVPAEQQPLLARSGLWGNGIEDFVRIVNGWIKDNNLAGMEIQY
ncbi:monooxygenase [Dendryphion nanum]|uniref:Monooxygenase n=1 Tax=Dendryphion nanum TaxID=256645 RepID=A0A9P9IT40_9PLEO|nr:monooxygenase [Dendryphion nanum]